MDPITIIKFAWGLLTSRAGIIIVASLLSLGLGIYGTSKVTGWWHEHEIAKITNERENALRDLNQEKQKVKDLEATIKFQRGQLALRQRVQKETSDVKKAVVDNDRDYLRRNYQRLHDYKNPAAAPGNSSGQKRGFRPAPQVGTAH
jgi:hypothetical protein